MKFIDRITKKRISKKTGMKALCMMITMVLAAVTVSAGFAETDTQASSPEVENYADIIGLYKTVDETIEMLIDRCNSGDDEYHTYFIKSGSETLDTSGWEKLIFRRTEEPSWIDIVKFNPYTDMKYAPYSFHYGNNYYHILCIRIKYGVITAEQKKEYDEKVRYVEESLGLFSPEMSDFEKAAIIRKYMGYNIIYGDGIKEYGGQTAYEALVRGRAACAGCARLYLGMLNDVGIGSLWVTSDNHAWNLVQLGDNWYHCDATAAFENDFKYHPYPDYIPSRDSYSYMGDFFGTKELERKSLGADIYELDADSRATVDYFNCNIPEESYFEMDEDNISMFWLKLDYTAPTCTTAGSYTIGGDGVEKEHTVNIPATHYYTYTTTTEPTCIKDGAGTATCTLCGHTETYSILATGHQWDFKARTADCEIDGYEMVCCKECGEVYWGEDAPAYGHQWSEWTSAGLYYDTRTCANCGKAEYRDKQKETTPGAPTSEENVPKDRGYGIVAYYDELNKMWLCVHPETGETFPIFNGENLTVNGITVAWNDRTHTFEKAGGNGGTTSTGVGTEATHGTDAKPTDGGNLTDSIQSATTSAKVRQTTSPVAKETEKTVTPARVTVKSARNIRKKSIKVTWKKTKNAKKYQVQYSTDKKFKKKVKSKTTKKLNFTVKKLTKNKTYYVRIRGINGKVYGKWSTVKKVKIRK